jgi:hypothetical protein
LWPVPAIFLVSGWHLVLPVDTLLGVGERAVWGKYREVVMGFPTIAQLMIDKG